MRVIAGEFGGRPLKAPRGNRTRPTSDRVREAMFMALEPLGGLRVVDLFAGSGALGIEALSRGADWVDFVESARGARAVLAENLDLLGIRQRARVWPLTLPGGVHALAAALAAADVVLVDPPYGGREASAILGALGAVGVLRGNTRVVLEHHAKDEVPERAGGLAQVRQRRYGETAVTTYRAAVAPEGEEAPK